MAGCCTTTGCNNSFIGYQAAPATATSNNSVTLGNSSITTIRAQVTTITALSDIRDKTDVEPIPLGLEFIRELRPVKFTWNTRDGAIVGKKAAGFIAQEVLALTEKYKMKDWMGLVLEDNPEKLEANVMGAYPILVRAVQELADKVDWLSDELNLLKNKQ